MSSYKKISGPARLIFQGGKYNKREEKELREKKGGMNIIILDKYVVKLFTTLQRLFTPVCGYKRQSVGEQGLTVWGGTRTD